MLEDSLNRTLTNLSHSLTIPEHLIDESNQHRQYIFGKLQQKSRFKLDRCRLAGGAAKKTSISLSFDLDCVIYVNDQQPPLTDILSEWEDILTMSDGNQIKDLRCTRRSVQFTFKEFSFDLLPAPNYTGARQNLDEQAKITWQKIKTHQTDRSNREEDICGQYSSGLSELAVKFLKKRSAFVHDLCRLAKFWNLSVYFGNYVSGRSSIIEALAVKAAEDEQMASINGTLSILRGFRRFLSLLENYNQIGISFKDMYPQGFPIPSYTKPYLIDPSNPFNNFLANIPKEFLTEMARYAKETQSRLDRCLKNPDEESLKLFYPQPQLFKFFDQPIHLNNIRTTMSVHLQCKAKFADLIIRRETFDRKTMEIIKELIAGVVKHIHATVRVGPYEKINEKVLKAAEQFFNTSLYQTNCQWVPTTNIHDDQDITFVIPLHTEKAEGLYISMTK